MKFKFIIPTFLIILFFPFLSFSQSMVWSENFETDGYQTRYVATSDGGFRDGTNDYFTRTDGSNISIQATSYLEYSGNYFWATEDTNDNGGDGNAEQVIQFTGINISGYTNLTLSALFGVGNNNGPGNSNFDNHDHIKVNYSIDGGAETNGIWFNFENHGDNYNEPLGLDANFDGNADQIDGTNRLGSNLQLFSIPVATGTILNLSVKIYADAGSEEVAIDDFKLTGDLTGTQIAAISVTKTSLSDFEYMENNGPSLNQSFYVSGSNLTNKLTITPPANYEISTDGINFQSTAIIINETGGIASSIIYSHLKSGLASGNYNGENIIISSSEATSKTITCNGFVTVYVEMPNAWINEFHYDNISIDKNEFVEVVIENASLFTLSDFTVSLYNGTNGEIYDSKTLNNIIPLESLQGYSFYYLPMNSIQNGPDGIGLDWQGYHIQLLSYEDSFKATEGPANNKFSTDILIEESNSETPEGNSLQLRGTGFRYNDFRWVCTASTPGTISKKQLFDTPIPAVPINHNYFLILFFVLALPSLFKFFKH